MINVLILTLLQTADILIKSISIEILFQFFFFDNSNSFSIIHINARSFVHNHEQIENYLYELTFKFNFIIISESWMKQSDIGNFELSNYNSFHTIRTNKRGGGVSIFIKNSLKSEVVNYLSK